MRHEADDPVESGARFPSAAVGSGTARLSGHIHQATDHDYRGIQVVATANMNAGLEGNSVVFRVWRIDNAPPYEHEIVNLNREKR